MAVENLIYRSGEFGNDDKVELTGLTLNKDENNYYLSAKFRVEDAHSIRRLDIPKIRLNIRPNNVSLIAEGNNCRRRSEAYINLGFGNLPLECYEVDGVNVMYTEKILEEKYTEMTMDEIEKKLGYKVKIVNK